MTRLNRIQLWIFALVSALAITYGGFTLFNAGSIFNPPYRVTAQFQSAGGIYPRADVDLLGTRVGSVEKLKIGPGTGTSVVMSIDPAVRLPHDITARIEYGSVIGEQYVELTPRSAATPYLANGAVISAANTTSPIDTATLLDNASALLKSLNPTDLSTVMNELATGLNGTGADLSHLADDSATISKASVASAGQLTALIRSAQVTLRTQVAVAPQTTALLQSFGQLLPELQRLDPDVATLLANGAIAQSGLTSILKDNATAIPLLLDDVLNLTNVLTPRLPAIRKTLVIFPWILESVSAAFRYCDEINPTTAKPVASTCHYDDQGRPFYSVYLAVQLPQPPGGNPYYGCTKGYGDTKRYLPNGSPVSGSGPKEALDADPNLNAHCTASPTDSVMPNLRGSQNIPGANSPTSTNTTTANNMAIYDPNTNVLATPHSGTYQFVDQTPPTSDSLGWLLTGAMRGAQ